MAVQAETQEPGTTRCRVLVVEDDPSSRRALVLLLRLKGFQTNVASTIREAIEQLQSNPGCLLLDLMLPDGNGTTVLEYIRDRDLPIRVAVTTGAGNWQAMLESVPGRPDAVFTKPLDFEKLVGWLNLQ